MKCAIKTIFRARQLDGMGMSIQSHWVWPAISEVVDIHRSVLWSWLASTTNIFHYFAQTILSKIILHLSSIFFFSFDFPLLGLVFLYSKQNHIKSELIGSVRTNRQIRFVCLFAISVFGYYCCDVCWWMKEDMNWYRHNVKQFNRPRSDAYINIIYIWIKKTVEIRTCVWSACVYIFGL